MNSIRDAFKHALVGRPRGISMTEFNEIVSMLIDSIEANDERLFTRLNYWLRQPDLDAKIVCSNVEFVRFGIMSARSDRNEKSGEHIPPTFQNQKKHVSESLAISKSPNLADPGQVDRFLKKLRIAPFSVKQLRGTVENCAQIIDDWVVEQINAKSFVNLPDLGDITLDEKPYGRVKLSEMKYISVHELIDCIAESENATSLRRYAMDLMAAFKLYQTELALAKDQALDQKDDKIDELSRKIDDQTAMMKEQHRNAEEQARLAAERDAVQRAQIDEQTAQIAKLLGFAVETNDKLDDVKEQNTTLNEKADALLDGQKQIYNKAVEIQRKMPVEHGNRNRDPCFALTFFLYNHKVNGPTIRLIPLKCVYLACFHFF